MRNIPGNNELEEQNMNFKLGQKVVLRRNNGSMNQNQEYDYYYGEQIRNIPLGTKAVIYRINPQRENQVELILRNTRIRYMVAHYSSISQD